MPDFEVHRFLSSPNGAHLLAADTARRSRLNVLHTKPGTIPFWKILVALVGLAPMGGGAAVFRHAFEVSSFPEALVEGLVGLGLIGLGSYMSIVVPQEKPR
jgi:hypothetical protein